MLSDIEHLSTLGLNALTGIDSFWTGSHESQKDHLDMRLNALTGIDSFWTCLLCIRAVASLQPVLTPLRALIVFGQNALLSAVLAAASLNALTGIDSFWTGKAACGIQT